ncbi:MAG: protein-disulfide reductase DsbD family protein [Candidatus Brocadiia bacterium]
MKWKNFALTLLTCFFVAVPLHAQDISGPIAGNEDGEDRVEIELSLQQEEQVPGEPVMVLARFTVPEEWYVFADSVAIERAEEVDWLEPQDSYTPEPKEKYDELLEQEVRYHEGTFTIRRIFRLTEGLPDGQREVNFDVSYQACSPDVCYPPDTRSMQADLDVLPEEAGPVSVEIPEESDREPVESQSLTQKLQQGDILVGILMAFATGLALSLTPCVYPMIPITISVIGATGDEGRWSGFGRSLLYVLGISLTYAILGVVAATTGRAFGTMLQHPALYVALALLFVVLAGAMFDFYSIDLLGSTAGKLQQKVRGRAGMMGIVVLGVLSGIALTPCSAPVIIAAMGYVLESGNLFLGFVIFFAIAWGMGTPLVVLGTFSGMLESLPKSGGWQNLVKQIFGFGLLGGALYYLRQSGLLGDFWFTMTLGALLLVISVFVGAFDSLQPQSDTRERTRKSVGLILLLASVIVLGGPFLDGPGEPADGVKWLSSAARARKRAEEEERPVMIYFTQDFCPSCRKLERDTFSDPRVNDLSEQMITLKVDGTNPETSGGKEELDRYDVLGFPTIVFAGPDGNAMEQPRITGYVGPAELKDAMERVIQETGTQ